MMSEDLGASLRAFRERLGLPRRVVARAVGRSEKTVQNWEAGTWKPGEEDRRRLEAALSLEPGRLSPTQLKGHALEAHASRGVLLIRDCKLLIESCAELLEHCAEYLRHVDARTIGARAEVRDFREAWTPDPDGPPLSPEVEARIEKLVERHVIPERDMSESLEEEARWGRVPEVERVSDEEWNELVTECEKGWVET